MSNIGKKRRKYRHLPPFLPLGECIGTLENAYKKASTAHFTTAMMAQLLHVTTKSSAFRRRLSAFRQFGLIEGAGETIILSPTAMSIIAPQRENERADAKLKAFETVGLFRKLKDKQQGGLLPNQEFIVNELIRNYSMDGEEASLWADSYIRSGEEAGVFSRRPDGTTLVLAKPFEEEKLASHLLEAVKEVGVPQEVIEAPEVPGKPASKVHPSERWNIPIPIEGEEEMEAYLDLPYKRMTERQVDLFFESIEALKPYLKLISRKVDAGKSKQGSDT